MIELQTEGKTESGRVTGGRALRRLGVKLANAGVNVIAALLAVTVCLYYAARWGGLGQAWLVSIIGHVLPWLFLPVLVLLPAAVLRRSRALLVLVGVLVLLFALTYGHLYLPRWSADAVGPEFTAMCYNVRSSNADAGAVAGVIASQSPDFVVLRELESGLASSLEALLIGSYPHYRITPGTGGFWSRYEILEYELWQLGEDRAYWAQRVTLDIEGRPVNVVGVHLRYGPVLQGVQPLGLPVVVPTGSADRSSDTDVHALLKRLEGVDGPLIVMGDFNMTDQQDLYGLLLQRLLDSHRESGWGMGFTQAPLYGIDVAMLRIDYVFYSPELTSISTRVGGFGGSDHRPVVSRLAWRAPVRRVSFVPRNAYGGNDADLADRTARSGRVCTVHVLGALTGTAALCLAGRLVGKQRMLQDAAGARGPVGLCSLL